MTSTFTPNLTLEEPGNADYVNSWNVPLNSNFTILDTAIGGSTTINVVGASGTNALTAAQYRNRTIIFSGAQTANLVYTLPSGVGGFWFIYNNTSGAYTITLSSLGGGTTLSLRQGYTTAVICDGTNVGRADTNPASAAGSSNQVQYNSGGAFTGSPNFVFTSSGFLGIGTSNPSSLFNVYSATAAFVNIEGDSSTSTSVIRSSTDATGANIVLRKARGTTSARTAVASGDSLGTLFFSAFGGTNSRNIASISSLVGTYTSDTDISSVMTFGTTPTGSSSATERMRIDSNGNVCIGTTSASSILTVAGTVTATSFTGAGTGLTGTAGGLSIGGNAATATTATNATNATNATTSTTQPASDSSTNIATTAFVHSVTLGDGQTWQDLTGSRSPGVTYTNSTNRSIQLRIVCLNTSGATANLVLNGTLSILVSDSSGSFYAYQPIDITIPSGTTYALTGSPNIQQWLELR